MQGDESVAYGALFAGCNFFAGYPITPASETAETMSLELPNTGGYYIQMEDEIASMSAIIGAAWGGGKTMTATSGPGFSLMQEAIGYGCMTETPCVIVDVQRSGPSTGQATKPAQGDLLQARWGTHGDHEIIALAPNSVTETFELVIEAFNLSEEYRTPVIFLMDGEIGHVREKITFPDPEDVKTFPRKKAKKGDTLFGGENVPPMSHFGEGFLIHVTGSTHKGNGMRDVVSQSVHEELILRQNGKISDNREKITMVEKIYDDDAEYSFVTIGVSSRPTLNALRMAKEMGIPMNFLRLKTVWPFPIKEVEELGKRSKKIFVPEMNLGQLSREIQRFTSCDVINIPKIGGVSHGSKEIFDIVRKHIGL